MGLIHKFKYYNEGYNVVLHPSFLLLYAVFYLPLHLYCNFIQYMAMKRNICFIIFILLSATIRSNAQGIDITAGIARGILLKKGIYLKSLIKTTEMEYYSAGVSWTAKGDSVNQYDVLWGRPTIEGGLMIGDFSRIQLHRTDREWARNLDYISGMGLEVTPYAAFSRSLLRSRKFDVGYRLENGIGISTRKYNRDTNVENEIIGSTVSVFVGMGFYASWNVSNHVQLSLGANLRHYSNGKLNQPNMGGNTANAEIRALYRFDTDSTVRKTYSHHSSRYHKNHLYADFSAMWCPQTLLSDWKYDYRRPPRERRNVFPLYDAWALSGALMWSYSPKYASGIGIDYTYMPYINELEASELRLDRNNHEQLSPHSIGVSLKHEAFYKNVSLNMSFGIYLHHNIGETARLNQKNYYENIGIRWYMPFTLRKAYVGYSINACEIKANYFQFTLGYCPWKKF